jgi:hypothetical protein
VRLAAGPRGFGLVVGHDGAVLGHHADGTATAAAVPAGSRVVALDGEAVATRPEIIEALGRRRGAPSVGAGARLPPEALSDSVCDPPGPTSASAPRGLRQRGDRLRPRAGRLPPAPPAAATGGRPPPAPRSVAVRGHHSIILPRSARRKPISATISARRAVRWRVSTALASLRRCLPTRPPPAPSAAQARICRVNCHPSFRLVRQFTLSEMLPQRPRRAGGRPGACGVSAPAVRGPALRGLQRARSRCRFALPLIHFIPYSRTGSAPLFLKRQCDRTLGLRPWQTRRTRRRAGGRRGGGATATAGCGARGSGGARGVTGPHARAGLMGCGSSSIYSV